MKSYRWGNQRVGCTHHRALGPGASQDQVTVKGGNRIPQKLGPGASWDQVAVRMGTLLGLWRDSTAENPLPRPPFPDLAFRPGYGRGRG